jgi:uncharacterized protein (DUF983 family)
MRAKILKLFENLGWLVVMVIILTMNNTNLPIWFQVLLVIVGGFSIIATCFSLIKRFRGK